MRRESPACVTAIRGADPPSPPAQAKLTIANFLMSIDDDETELATLKGMMPAIPPAARPWGASLLQRQTPPLAPLRKVPPPERPPQSPLSQRGQFESPPPQL